MSGSLGYQAYLCLNALGYVWLTWLPSNSQLHIGLQPDEFPSHFTWDICYQAKIH